MTLFNFYFPFQWIQFQRIVYSFILLFIIFICLPNSCASQIVNIEKERIRNHDSIGFEGKLSTNINFSDNKNKQLNIDINPHLQYKNKKHIVLGVALWEYATLNNKIINNGGFIHCRYNYELRKNLKAEFFTQIQYNTIWNMPLRYILGGGPRIKILERNKNKLYFGPLYMYEIQYQKRDDFIQYNHRLSAYVSWNTYLNKIIFFTGTIYYQPLIRDFANYRLSGLTECNVALGKRFTLNNRFSYIFDQTQTIDIPAHTFRYTAGVNYYF